MSNNCQSEHADVSSDDEQEIMRRNWKKNISTIEKAGTLIEIILYRII